MNISNTCVNFSVYFLFLVFMCSCDKPNISSEKEELNEITNDLENFDQEDLYYVQRYFLPYKQDLYFLTPEENTEKDRSNALLDSSLLIGNDINTLIDEGITDGKTRYGHYLVCAEGKVRGLSFLPAGSNLAQDDSRLQTSIGLGEFGNVESIAESTIHSIQSISSLSDLEFIEFGLERITPEVWQNILYLSDNKNLTGLFVLQTENFFESWPGLNLVNIRGLICYVDSISMLEKIGEAFPNLEFLCVIIKGNSEFREVFPYLLTSNHFENLKSLMFGHRYWHISQIDMIGKHHEIHGPLRVDIKNVNKGLKWIGVDGGMLKINDMISYNQFARGLTYQRNNLGVDGVDIRFIKYGYANDVCRSFTSIDYHDLEKYWR